jgi:hypothetical protein
MEEIMLRNAARKWAGKPLLSTPKSSLFSDPHTSAAQSPYQGDARIELAVEKLYRFLRLW